MLELKPDEFLVGSGDGTVSLVKDMTYAKASSKGGRAGKSGAAATYVKEPTDQVLKEVNCHNNSLLQCLHDGTFRHKPCHTQHGVRELFMEMMNRVTET